MSPPRRIGVLTFHRCINYGSYWQARCLVEGLRRRGLDAVLLDHHSARVNRAEWRCALSPHMPEPTRAHDRPAYARKARRFLAAFERLPLSPPICLDAPESCETGFREAPFSDAEAYDLVLVGSDEVWNQRHPWYGGALLFYGAGAPSRRLAAYAASFGNQPATDRLDALRAGLLRRFEAISVRDDNSRALVRKSLGRTPALVLDPCLQFPPEVPEPQQENRNFILVYGHSFPEWFQAGVRAAAAAARLRILSFGYRNDWADAHCLDAPPEAFPAAVAGAAAVATTFFHGCVFALVHGRPFIAAASDYRANKVGSLLRLVGATDRLAGPATPAAGYHAALAAPPPPAVGARIAALRARSGAWLDHVLT